PLRERMTKYHKVDMNRAPIIARVEPRVSSGLDGSETVEPVMVRNRSAKAAKIWIESGKVALFFMPVTTAGISLPKLNPCVWNGARVLIKHLTINDHPLADCLVAVLSKVANEVVI